MLSKSDVNDCLALAVAVFPQFPLERSLIDGYYDLLSDLDCEKEDLLRALKEVLRTSSWFPTVALIREQVLKKPSNQPPQFSELDYPQKGAELEVIRQIRESFKV